MKPKVTHYRLKVYPEGINDDEIDRAMQWCVEYLRVKEIELANTQLDEWFYSLLSKYMECDANFCIRFLEKVEQELEGDNE